MRLQMIQVEGGMVHRVSGDKLDFARRAAIAADRTARGELESESYGGGEGG